MILLKFMTKFIYIKRSSRMMQGFFCGDINMVQLYFRESFYPSFIPGKIKMNDWLEHDEIPSDGLRQKEKKLFSLASHQVSCANIEREKNSLKNRFFSWKSSRIFQRILEADNRAGWKIEDKAFVANDFITHVEA